MVPLLGMQQVLLPLIGRFLSEDTQKIIEPFIIILAQCSGIIGNLDNLGMESQFYSSVNLILFHLS